MRVPGSKQPSTQIAAALVVALPCPQIRCEASANLRHSSDIIGGNFRIGRPLFAMLKTPKPENGREDMMTDDPMELHKMRTRRIARIVSWVTGVLWVAFALFWVSFLVFRFDDKYLMWTPFFMIFLFMPHYLKRYLNEQRQVDEFNDKRDKEIFNPIRERLQQDKVASDKLEQKQVAQEMTASVRSRPKPSGLSEISLSGYYKVPGWNFLAAFTLPYMIAFVMSMRRHSAEVFYPAPFVAALFIIATSTATGFLFLFIWKSRFSIQIANGAVRLNSGVTFDLKDIVKVDIKEPISTKDLRISFSRIRYSTGYRKKSFILFHDLQGYDDIVDLFIRAT